MTIFIGIALFFAHNICEFNISLVFMQSIAQTILLTTQKRFMSRNAKDYKVEKSELPAIGSALLSFLVSHKS